MDVSGMDQTVHVKSKRPSGELVIASIMSNNLLILVHSYFRLEFQATKVNFHGTKNFSRIFIDFFVANYRLPSWQPVLTAGTVLPTFFVIGIAFIPVGVALLYFSHNVSHPDCRNCDIQQIYYLSP